MKRKPFGNNCALLTIYDLKILLCLVSLEKREFLSKHQISERIGISYNKIKNRIINLQNHGLIHCEAYSKGNVKRYKIQIPYTKLKDVQTLIKILSLKRGDHNE